VSDNHGVGVADILISFVAFLTYCPMSSLAW
jgi:hypothetical protein